MYDCPIMDDWGLRNMGKIGQKRNKHKHKLQTLPEIVKIQKRYISAMQKESPRREA